MNWSLDHPFYAGLLLGAGWSVSQQLAKGALWLLGLVWAVMTADYRGLP